MRRLSSLLLMLVPAAVSATDSAPLLTIRDHRFTPRRSAFRRASGSVSPSTTRTRQPRIRGCGLNREKKYIPGRSKGVVFIGPLKPGRYPFFGEFNQKTAQGVIIAE